MAEEDIVSRLVSLVFTLEGRPGISNVLGVYADVVYDGLVAENPHRAYQIARESRDPVFLRAVTKRIIQRGVGGTDLEISLLEMYLSPQPDTVPQPVAVPVQSPAPTDFLIESLPDRYRLHNVPCEGNLSDINVRKVLLGDGAVYTQQEGVEKTKDGEWRIGSGPEQTAAVLALYENRDHVDPVQRGLVEEVKSMLRNDFRKYWMLTSTRIFYNVKGEDEVVHTFGYENERRVNRNILGPDGWLKENSGFGDVIEALVGSRDCALINDAYLWVSGKQVYLCRLNERPKQNVERALVLGDYGSVRFSIDAGDYVDDYGRARGWSVRSAKNSP